MVPLMFPPDCRSVAWEPGLSRRELKTNLGKWSLEGKEPLTWASYSVSRVCVGIEVWAATPEIRSAATRISSVKMPFTTTNLFTICYEIQEI
jgi:hypothetical protein